LRDPKDRFLLLFEEKTLLSVIMMIEIREMKIMIREMKIMIREMKIMKIIRVEEREGNPETPLRPPDTLKSPLFNQKSY
jgi:hypothetical protein